MDDWIGKSVAQVRIDKLISRGGMGGIYLGWHEVEERPVAVKIMHAQIREDLFFQRRFQREAEAIAGMQHPNIVHCLDCNVVQGRPYIIMDLLEGMPLHEYLRVIHGQGLLLPLHIVVGIVRSLASALDYAHESGVLHLDVKPSNIVLESDIMPVDPSRLIPPDLKAVLTDFGLARMADVMVQATAEMFMGTPAYVSPEQIRGDSADLRSDIYSFGVVIYELLEGQAPFDPLKFSVKELLHKQLEGTPPPMQYTAREVERVVLRAMAKEPEKRYPSAGDLAQDLMLRVDRIAPNSARLA